jgi:hypothetical protein
MHDASLAAAFFTPLFCCPPVLLLQTRAEAELKKVLTDADAPACLRLLLNDAGTFDLATKTGGCDGSIVLP